MKPNTQERRLGSGLRCLFTQPTTVMLGYDVPSPNTQFGISFTEEKRNSYHCFLSRCLFMFFNILRKNGNFSAIALDFWVASF
ncbi:UNVERIFIED_CONTAM: hypothetical protein BEN50_04600 [Euhalothece sp. KZN 001]